MKPQNKTRVKIYRAAKWGLTVEADSTTPLPFYSKQVEQVCQILMFVLCDKNVSFDQLDDESNLLLLRAACATR
jgi:hypothetical protein